MIRRATLLAALALTLALALAATAVGPAGAAQPRTSLNDIEDEVMCVVCGVPLNIAESPQADRERALIRGLVARGDTKAQVKAELVRQYGNGVLATPGGHGFAIANWLVPAAVIALLLLGVGLLVPRWLRRPPGGPDGEGEALPPVLADEQTRRLDDDLSRYR